jgi:hypothetical protein
VLFIAAFVVVQLLGALLTWTVLSGREITPESYAAVRRAKLAGDIQTARGRGADDPTILNAMLSKNPYLVPDVQTALQQNVTATQILESVIEKSPLPTQTPAQDAAWHLYDEEQGKRMYQTDSQTWNKYQNVVQWQDHHPMPEKLSYLIAVAAAICIAFVLVSRAFFYIVTGDWRFDRL